MASDGTRKHRILEALAEQLEGNPGRRVTTASLAQSVGVSEAALYRHFPSKAKMFEGLIEFAEESVFGRINQILAEERSTRMRCSLILYLVLGFSARNPGITRVLLGDALVGETERLRTRVDRFFARVETQLKQVVREAGLRGDVAAALPADAAANLMVAWAEGRMHQFLRSGYQTSPTQQWEVQWKALENGIFTDAPLPADD